MYSGRAVRRPSTDRAGEWCSTKSFRRSRRGSRRFPADRIVGKCSLLRVQSVSAVVLPVRLAIASGDALCGDAPINLAVGVDKALDHSLCVPVNAARLSARRLSSLSYCSLSEPCRLVESASPSGSQPCSRFCCAGTQLAGRQLFFQWSLSFASLLVGANVDRNWRKCVQYFLDAGRLSCVIVGGV